MKRGDPREATWCCAGRRTFDDAPAFCPFCGHDQSEPNVKLPHPLEVGMLVRITSAWVGEVLAEEIDEGRGLSVTMPEGSGSCNLSFDQVAFPLCNHPACQGLRECQGPVGARDLNEDGNDDHS